MINSTEKYGLTNFLLCVKGESKTFSHRFVLHGDEYTKTAREAKGQWKKTSHDQPENICDLLVNLSPFPIVVINLDGLVVKVRVSVMDYFGWEIGRDIGPELYEGFTSSQVEKIIGINANTLHYYVQDKALIPDIDKGEGTGKTRKFSETNLIEAMIIKHFMEFGLPRRSIVSIFQKINDAGERKRLHPSTFFKQEKNQFDS